LIPDYDSLRNDFNDFEIAHVALGKEKENVEKSECEKSQRFRNLVRKKLIGFRNDMKKIVAMLGGQCFEFLAIGATVGDLLDWFRTEVQALPTAFAESKQNITRYVVAGILRMLARVECGHLSELQRFSISCDASLLHDVPEDLGRIAGRLV
jgi:hypothetical protein